jgi:hypothetical protein
VLHFFQESFVQSQFNTNKPCDLGRAIVPFWTEIGSSLKGI